MSIAAVETVSQSPENLATNLDNLRRVEPDALVYMGYGMLAAKGLLREALDKLGWDPPRIMGTAFMFYLMGFDKFEGWVGVDQLDPSNPLVDGFHRRYVARYGEDPPFWPNAIPVLAYDTARVLVEGLFRAPILSGPGLKAGLESIRFMPSTTGGSRTHIACSPHEHGMFRGDWLLYGRVTNGKLEFEGSSTPGTLIPTANHLVTESQAVPEVVTKSRGDAHPTGEAHRGHWALRCRLGAGPGHPGRVGTRVGSLCGSVLVHPTQGAYITHPYRAICML